MDGSAEQNNKVRTVPSDNAFQRELKNAGDKLVVVHFTMEGCPPSAYIAPIFDELAPHCPNVVFLRVYIDICQTTAYQYDIDAAPTFSFFKNGEKVDKDIVGGNIIAVEAAIALHSTSSTNATPLQKLIKAISVPNDSSLHTNQTEHDSVGSSPRNNKVISALSDDAFQRELIMAGDKLVVIHFTMEGCRPSELVAPEFDALAPHYPNVVFLTADIHTCNGVSKLYKIDGAPTFSFFKNREKLDKDVRGGDIGAVETTIALHRRSAHGSQWNQGRSVSVPGSNTPQKNQVITVPSDHAFQRELIMAAKKLVVVHFTMEGCRPSDLVAPAFDELAPHCPDVVFLRVYIDNCYGTAYQYKINSAPTFTFFESKEKLDKDILGGDISAVQTVIALHMSSEAATDAKVNNPPQVGPHREERRFLARNLCLQRHFGHVYLPKMKLSLQ